MGEPEFKVKDVVVAVKSAVADIGQPDQSVQAGQSDPMSVQTPGGRIHVRWDLKANTTAMGQIVFFAEFLEVTGVFDRWIEQCPLAYTSPNAPATRDVLGTWLLSILDGHHRYAHVACLRGDAVAPQVLGMDSIKGDESLRRGLASIAPPPKETHTEEARLLQQTQVFEAKKWMLDALGHSIGNALLTPWILDIDTTIKTLFGKQNGAEISYNPHKPGRPSHAIHTYWVGNLRLVLRADVQNGLAHSAAHTLPGLIELLMDLPKEQRPELVRGDCAFGNETVMVELEEIHQHYLFKLKQTSNVQKLIERLGPERAWADAGQGWQACEDTLKLVGWTRHRRVIVLRQAVRIAPESGSSKGKSKLSKLTAGKKMREQQYVLDLFTDSPADKLWRYAVLVTNADYDIEEIGQLYRDRADCENGFDELKNQWGWGGYCTQDIERCNLSARAVALIYNWWSWYVRLANPAARMEAITSRPMLLAAVGRVTSHGGQTHILLSISHAAATKIKGLVLNIRAGLDHVMATAPQLPFLSKWTILTGYIIGKILDANAKKCVRAAARPFLASG